MIVFSASLTMFGCDSVGTYSPSPKVGNPQATDFFPRSELKNDISVDSLNNLAVNLYMQGDYQRAMDYISVAFKKSKDGDDRVQFAKILNTLGLVHWRLENNEDAKQCYIESGAIAEAESEFRLLGLTYTNRSLILKEEENYDEALAVNNKAIEIFKKNDLFRDLGIAYNNNGQIFKKKNELEIAKTFYNKALDIYRKVDYKDGVAATYYNLSQIAMWQGMEKESLLKGQESLALALEIESKVRISEAYLKIAETYEYFNHPEPAIAYYKKHYENKWNILESTQSENLARFQAELGAEVKNLRIDNLEKEKKIAQNHFYFMLALGLLLILVGGFVLYRYTLKIRFKQKELERDVKNYNQILLVKEQELKAYIVDLSSKTSLIAKLQNELTDNTSLRIKNETVVQLLKTKILTDEDWEVFKSKFISIHPEFFSRMNETRHQLTEAEIRYMLLLRLKLTSKEMASILGISPQSVRVCKMRLKKKLNKEGIESVELFLEMLIG
ncbi:MAG: tetratricopeptide repeat protein [Leeuwenhoekiella sp.]